MSRSYKKWPSVTYRVKGFKQIYNRGLRKKNRSDYYDFPQGTKYRHSYCSWNIRDYIFTCDYETFYNNCRVDYTSDNDCYADWVRIYKMK